MKRTASPISRLVLVLGLVMSLGVAFVQAGDIRQFKIDLPEKIFAGQEATIAIAGLDADKNPITRDSRDLDIKISNGGQTVTKTIMLAKGKGKLTHTFDAPGATLIMVVDPEDPAVVDYKSLVVDFNLESLK